MDDKTNTTTPMNTFKVGESPSDVTVNPNTSTIYVTNGESNMTSVIDGRTNTLMKNIMVGDSPVAVAVNPNTNMIYVANYDEDTVSVIDGKTNAVINSF